MMTYVQGFVIPAHQDNREAYRDMAAKAAPIFAEYGAQRIVETWGDDIPDGKQTDMKRAVQANPDEQIVYSWVIRSEEHTSELQSLMRISYAVFCLKKKTNNNNTTMQSTTHKRNTYS